MKYIDAEKLKKIVEQAKQRALKGAEVDEDLYCDGRADAFGEVLLEIDSLQQEQPSLPANLDEAAFTYENDLWKSGFKDSGYTPQEVSDAFKAGAKYDRSTVKAELLEWAKENRDSLGRLSYGEFIEKIKSL